MSGLRIVDFPEPAPDASIVAILREWLADAERGELVAIALAGVCRGGECQTCTSVAPDASKLWGVVTRLQHRLMLTADKADARNG